METSLRDRTRRTLRPGVFQQQHVAVLFLHHLQVEHGLLLDVL